jgi:hypothetical protein
MLPREEPRKEPGKDDGDKEGRMMMAVGNTHDEKLFDNSSSVLMYLFFATIEIVGQD